MEKLKLETPDFTQQNIDRIAELFPSAITETKDEDGKLKRAINFTVLKQLLSDEVVDGEECYEFTWVGKKQSIIEGNRPIRKTLRPVKEESKNWDTTENLYIEGDNLEVLKLLQNSYLNSIKMIYIDPPYNTGNDFVYRDDFKVSREEYEDEMGVYDEDDNRLFKNTETNGRFHSDWCSMMYPRLQLARNLLSEDGVIFISIDDNEVRNLKNLCDEVFGESNFLTNVIWQRTYAPISMKKYFSENHEFLLIYAKQKSLFNLNLLPRTEKQNKDYKNPDNDPRGLWKGGNLTVGPAVEKQVYEIIGPTGKSFYPPKGYCWRFSKERFEELRKDNRIWFGADGNNSPLPKLFLTEVQDGVTPMTIWTFDEVGHGQEATRELRKIFDDAVFTNPKPLRYLHRIINLGLNKNDLILDFFSGSSTTAHAVMQLNAEDGGNRKFIMVQLPEETDEKSEAYKAGYKNICEIGKERIRRAGKKIEEELEAKSNKGDLFDDEKEVKTVDTGFRVLKVDDTNMKDVYYSADEYSQQMLLNLESNIKDDRDDMDLLYGVLLDWGVPLSLPHTTETIEGKRVHFVNEDNLVACFEDNVNETVVREIAKRKPERIVFRDSSFSSSPEKINVTEIFKTLSPDTSVKVI
ncbi:MAG TPA: site-specific DNA-methyltransferase [Porphyromonadaceae bacterium]|jgi:adenine-specific DNA-methyltransferase|nr:site-specific DNA-methyltransferase [Porphyromonadaceae bacterium]